MDALPEKITKEKQAEFLRHAEKAAASGDPKGMVDFLFRSYALDGLIRQLRKKWPTLHHDDIDYIVSESMNEVYLAVKGGEKVLNLLGLLWKKSFGKAFDRYKLRPKMIALDSEIFENIGKPDNPIEDDQKEEENRAKALKIARSLIPRLGQHNVQAVMSYLLEAIEAGRGDVPTQEVAEALGLNPDTVRQSISRGFRRLKRIATQEGLIDRAFDYDDIKPLDEQPDTMEDEE